MAGFRRERVGEEECYVMRPGNLNIPWLTVLERKLEGGEESGVRCRGDGGDEAAGSAQSRAAGRDAGRSGKSGVLSRTRRCGIVSGNVDEDDGHAG